MRALQAGDTGGALNVEVTDATDGGDDNFKLVVRRGGKVEEQHDNLSGSAKGKLSAVSAVKAASQLIELIETASAPAVRPANGTVTLASASATPARLEPSDYVGDVADRTGFGGLETIDEITMVCVPDVMAAYQKGAIDLEGVKAVQLAMIAHCELMADRIAIIDPPPDMSPQAVLELAPERRRLRLQVRRALLAVAQGLRPRHQREHLRAAERARGRHLGPQRRHAGRAQGPGQRDGARRDRRRVGPHLAASRSCSTPSASTACGRSRAGASGSGAPAPWRRPRPEWRYINVRRLFNYLEESILNGTQWVVFEPNDHALWARVRRTITAFLTNEWRKGALFGLTPDEAFYVKCDPETNPPDVVDAGQLVCEIGVAPVKPAEFVIFRLAQFSGGAALTE